MFRRKFHSLGMSKLSLLLFAAILNALVLFCVNTIVDTPYMDETFHVNQFLEIEKWIFSKKESEKTLVWDKSITTFPGLYLVSLPVSFFSTNLFLLRAINAILLPTITFLILMRITKSDNSLSLSAIFFPLNFFYSFLYYTDTVATGAVLVLVLLKAQKRFALMGIFGAIAVLMRQTNIVWLFGFCLSELLPRTHTSTFLSLCVSVIRDFYTSIAVGLGFVVFLVWNNYSVVLGHQEFHSFSLHFAQINYFVLTCVACTGPKEWCAILVKSVKNTRISAFLVFFALSVLASELGTVVHPFILADNRHYSFYFYRYFLSKRWIRSLVIPALVSLSILHSKIFALERKYRIMSKPVFWLCSFICLVPTPLLEFRYFTVPYLLLLLSSPWNRKELLFSNLFLSMLVNAAVMYTFLNRPFRSPDGSLSRFMY